MIARAAMLIFFLALQTETRSTRSGEIRPRSTQVGSVEKRGLLPALLGGKPPAGGKQQSQQQSQQQTQQQGQKPAGTPPPAGGRKPAGGKKPPGPLDPVSGLLVGVEGLFTPGAVMELINGVPKYNPAVSAAAPGRPPPQYTPGDAPWTQSEAAYRQLVTCPNGIGGEQGVVLLVPCTGGSGAQVYGRSAYTQILPQHGFTTCWVDNPTKSTGDIQLSAEYFAYAIKFLAEQSGRPISVVTYSQGGLTAQWALNFWPSLRSSVRNLVTLAAPFHGTIATSLLCPLLEIIGGCLPAIFQMFTNSRLVEALNAPVRGSGAVALVPTTSVYSYMDEIVLPQLPPRPISFLEGASNIAVQDICGPLHIVEHFFIIDDLASFSIALDALMHGRPANPATVDKSLCDPLASLGGELASIGKDLEYTFSALIGNLGDRVGMLLQTLTTLTVPVEPPLQMYVCERGFAKGCTANGFGGPQPRAPLLSDLPHALAGLF